MAEPSMSKSMSATSDNYETNKIHATNLCLGKSKWIDSIFPIYDQMMQKTKFPTWVMSFITIILMMQTLSVGLWIYSPIFDNVTPKWRNFYIKLLTVFIFTDPLDVSNTNGITMIISICVALFSLVYMLFLAWYQKKFYQIPPVYLYICSFIIDIVDSLFIIPSVNVIDHGVVSLKYGYHPVFVAEIVVGAVSFVAFSGIFLITTNLKSRSVVLTNLLFPLFDHFAVTLWVIATSFFSLISALFNYYHDWLYLVGNTIHLLLTIFICYKFSYMPFYELWRNSMCMAFSITSIALDLNYYVLDLTGLTYNYTIIVYICAFFISLVLSQIYFKYAVKKIKKQLTENPEVESVNDYLESLKFTKNSERAMMYINVGLTQICDYFIDGSITNYIISANSSDESTSILLQILTFFPYASRNMNVLFKKLVNKKKLKIADRFLIYQTYRIKLRRLVSDSKDTIEIFNMLNKRTEECKNLINAFYDSPNNSYTYVSSLGLIMNDLNSKFESVIKEIPNNVRIMNLYSEFLTECLCYFTHSVRIKIKSDAISEGKNFNVDVSFHSLVNKFPRLLKDKHVDTKGNRISKKNGDSNADGSTKKSGSSSVNNSSLNSSEYDVELQESVCQKTIRQATARLALHNAIVDSQPKEIAYIKIITTCLLVLNFIDFLVLYFFVISRLEWRKKSYENVGNLGYSTFYHIYSNLFLLIEFSVDTGRYDEGTKYIGDISIDSTFTLSILPRNITTPMKAYTCTNRSNSYLGDLIDSFAVLCEGRNPFDISNTLVSGNSVYKVCVDAKPMGNISASLKNQIVTSNYLSANIAGTMQSGIRYPNIFADNDYCQKMLNDGLVIGNTFSALDELLAFYLRLSSHNKLYFLIITVIIPAIVFVLTVTIFSLIIYSYQRRESKLFKALHNLPNPIKDDSKSPLLFKNEDSESNANNKLKTTNIMNQLPFFIYLFLLVVIAVFVSVGFNAIKLDSLLTTILNWFYFSCSRIVIASQLGNNAVQMILMNDSLPQQITDFETLKDNAVEDLEKMILENKELMYGTDTQPGSLNFDKKLDEYQLQGNCEIPGTPTSIHDMYACTSITQQMIMYRNMVNNIFKDPQSFQGTLNGEVASNMIHILRFHIYPAIIKVTKRIGEVMEETYDTRMADQLILVIVGLACSVVCFILPFLFNRLLLLEYKTVMVLIKRLPPKVVAETPEILDFFSCRKKTKKEGMSLYKSIVFQTSECIIITNQNATIEIVNDSVAANLGFSPDQMLGQQVTNFINGNDCQKINEQIDLMINNNGPRIWEDHIEMINDKNEMIPFAVTMIGISDANSNQVTSIVLSFTNESEVIEKRKAADIAKAKSEKLLYQILPKDIVVRLNRGETDISFTIPSATIFFIDIVKFSVYASSLTPSEIMTNLSTVFAAFDQNVSKYDLITKIKLIGDVYMAAAGLFQGEEDDPTKHADQSIKCCLDCIKSMDEINSNLESSIEVRIGVNSGGPLIGGVLGSDKPTFDIIGDTINVAARLQSTDIPGRIQISEGTKSLIDGLDYIIEERGEIFLKGKGNRKTFFVSHPNKNNSIENSLLLNLSLQSEN